MNMRPNGVAVLLAAVTLIHTPAQAGRQGWSQASSVERDLLLATALAVPATNGDWRGIAESGGSILLAGGTTYALKEFFPETRPDRSDRRSFPSGHTAESFAAAAALEERYGWRLGLPAFTVASFVAVARVEARKHHWQDCLAGAVIGTASGFLLTHPHDSTVTLTPWASGAGGGMRLAAQF
jgi:membrane-associated phospholipid phosphatase